MELPSCWREQLQGLTALMILDNATRILPRIF